MSKSMKFKSVYLVMLLSLLLSVLLAGGGVALAAAGDLVPMGDQLGDVGQYYSGIAPSMRSRVSIRNTTGSDNTTVVTVYDDTGITATGTYTCTLGGNDSMEFYFGDRDGKIYARGTDSTLTGTNCPTSGDNNSYHGVYSMVVDGTYNLAVSAQTWAPTGTGYVQTNASKGAYRAVREAQKSTTVNLPVLYLDRDGLWDSEVVVFNPGENDATISFYLCPDGDATVECFHNNSAVVKSHEHRIFMLSQLAYQDNSGSLTNREGYFGGYITSNYDIVATTNVFKHTLSGGKLYAENGADEFFSLGQPVMGTSGFYGVGLPGVYIGTGVNLRIVNTGGSATSVSIYGYDTNGTLQGTVSGLSIAAHEGTTLDYTYLNSNFGGGTRYFIVGSWNQEITVSTWQERTEGVWGWGGDVDGANTVYSPMFMAGYYGSDSLIYHANDSGSGSTINWSGAGYVNHYTDSGSLGTSGTHKTYTLDGRSAAGVVTQNEIYSVDVGPSAGGHTAIDVTKTYKPGVSTEDSANAYTSITTLDDIWYVPFAPAPVVQFAWDNTTTTGEPSGAFGIAFTSSDKRGDSTLNSNGWGWANRVNYYFWHEDGSHCADEYYIPLYSGVGRLRDGTTYNTSTRMASIRNDIASSCAGRPLLGLNEPDYSTQDNATYPEQARSIFVTRNWPGEMYSPAFGNRYWATGNIWNPNGYSSPAATSFPGLKNYYEDNDTDNANRPSWGQQLDYPIDGIAMHFYPLTLTDLQSGIYMDTTISAYLGNYNSYSTSHGNMPILVTEYGLQADHSGVITNTVNSIAGLNGALDSNLTYLKKKFWFSFYCPEVNCGTWYKPNLFEYSGSTPQLLSVGEEWCKQASTGTPTACTP